MISDLATWKPVAYKGLSKRTKNKAAVLHTNGAPAPDGLYSYYSTLAAKGQEGAHFQVFMDGRAEQYVDTDFVVGHAWDANPFAVGIETEDEGKQQPWTTAQTNTIIALLKELGVPPQVLPEHGGDGVGYHQEYPSWNRSLHNCPGTDRRNQVSTVIIPGLKPPPKGFLMALSDAEQDELLTKVRFLWSEKQNEGSALGIDMKTGGAADRQAKEEVRLKKKAAGE